MKRSSLLLTLLLACGLTHATSHFIGDESYRNSVEKAFNNKMELIGQQFFQLPQKGATTEETEALKFLYAYMPLADATDYTTGFYLDNVRMSFKARREMPWGKDVPELLFRHFVLPVRVNNENLDSSRTVFFRELKERVKGMTMRQAILEVNHWCHEHVTYTPSDARTLSPLACVKNALGRCGEESTFTVAALRAIGIPARQVYTPRWAHTDDNHAWVEAWADGKWWFLGACEPEPVLNLGWFNAPASRAMLMHTRAFGDYRGPEEVVLRTGNFTEINLIDNYASTARIDFHVTDTQGNPVDKAKVEFKIYNYAEFYTAVTKYTDATGATFLTAGKGDLVVWASKDGHYGFTKASFGKDKDVTIRLDRYGLESTPLDSFDIVPPAEHVNIPFVSDADNAANKIRFAREDSIRKAYEATFYHPASSHWTSLDSLLVTARGNWRTIQAFHSKHADNASRALALLKTLSDKDLRDMPMPILDDNMTAKSDQLCPRVEDEMIILPFKHLLQDAFDDKTSASFRKDPSRLVAWVQKNIRLNPDRKALRIAQTPVGVWRSRVTDSRSRDIFFVDMARSIGIEARKDVVTSKVQYKLNGQWVDVDFEAQEQKAAPTGTLVLRYQPTKYLDDPKYYSHFTISRIEDGQERLLNFDEGQVDMGGGTSWSNTFRDGTPLDCGTYILVTGTRLASGAVLSANQTFTIHEGQTTTLDLILRQNSDEVSVIGTFDSESKFTPVGKAAPGATSLAVGAATDPVSILSQTGRGYFVIGILGVGQEPTNHALRDIAKARQSLDTWGRPFVLLFETEEDARKFNPQEFGLLPSNTFYGIDKDGSIRHQIAVQMKMQNERQLPMFIIGDTFNRVVFSSQGYTIGLGEQLEKVIHKL